MTTPEINGSASPRLPQPCEGISARWCPNHGDCTCGGYGTTTGQALGPAISDVLIGKVIKDHFGHMVKIRALQAALLAEAIIDGPLSDLSVLVQIPAVRELVEEVEDIASQFGPDYLFQKHNERFVRPWLDALEATR